MSIKPSPNATWHALYARRVPAQPTNEGWATSSEAVICYDDAVTSDKSCPECSYPTMTVFELRDGRVGFCPECGHRTLVCRAQEKPG